MSTKKLSTSTLTLGAMMTALVIVFQLLATYTTFFGPFSTAIALVPIVIGAIMCGPAVGAWLGFVFGMVVLLTGGAALFWAFNIPGTIITVLAKGMGCGFVAGLINNLIKKHNKDIAAVVAAIICPIVNTGLFLLGGFVFFMPYAEKIAIGADLVKFSGFDVFIALATGNFLFELGMCIVLSPIIARLLRHTRKV